MYRYRKYHHRKPSLTSKQDHDDSKKSSKYAKKLLMNVHVHQPEATINLAVNVRVKFLQLSEFQTVRRYVETII